MNSSWAVTVVPSSALHVGHYTVVEAGQSQVELGDDEVLVVAGIADEGDALAVAGLVETVGAVDRHGPRAGDGLHQQRRLASVDVLVEQVR